MFKKVRSSKAAAILTRGAYSQYVSTAKGRERRWRLFSTFPVCKGRAVPPDGMDRYPKREVILARALSSKDSPVKKK